LKTSKADPDEEFRLNQREKVMVGVAVAVALAFGVPMALGALNSGPSTDQQVARLRQERRSKAAEERTVEKNTKQLEPQVRMMAWDVPPEQLRQEIVRKVSSIAQASGATLVTTRPLKPRGLDLVTEVSVELHLTTTLPKLVKFLYPLQQPSNRLTVDRLRMAATTTESDLLDVDLTVSGYTLQVPQEATAATRRSS
jgi:Tfp pilus assembly protein PilO